MIFEVLIYPGILFLVVMSLLYSGILRKVRARMQNRIGPSWFQPFYDTIKLLGKEDVTPEQAKPGFTLWPLLALTCAIVAGLFMPIAGLVAFPGSADIIIVIYFMLFSSISLYMSGFASANPYSVISSIRGVIQMVAYEFPFLASVLVPVIYMQSLSLLDMNNYQVTAGPFAAMFPFAAVAFFVSVLAEAEVPPFHVPRAHQELVSGYETEYSGPRLAMIQLTHFLKLFVMLALFVALFLGGSLDLLTFTTRTLAVLFLVIISNVDMARVRIMGSVKMCWLMGFVALIDLFRVVLFP
jgi:NADH-quinone oxidoreductase subunit H